MSATATVLLDDDGNPTTPYVSIDTSEFGHPQEIGQLFEENQHSNLAIRGYLFEMGQRLRFQMNYSFLKRCPSPLSSSVHGSPRMW